MREHADTGVRRFYEEQLRYYGPHSAKALAWREEKSQRDRFEIVAQVGNLNGSSVMDEGCGLGDLYSFLAARFSDISYTGVDISPELIKKAEKKYGRNYGGSSPVFKVSDFSEYSGGPFDYVLSSGALTFKIPNYKEVYFGHIKKMFELSRIGVAFNMLDETGFPESELLVRYSAAEVFDFCRTLFTPHSGTQGPTEDQDLSSNIIFRNDYSDEDFTFYLYH